MTLIYERTSVYYLYGKLYFLKFLIKVLRKYSNLITFTLFNVNIFQIQRSNKDVILTKLIILPQLLYSPNLKNCY